MAQRERELAQTRSEHKEQLEKLTFDLKEGRQNTELAQSEKEQVIMQRVYYWVKVSIVVVQL